LSVIVERAAFRDRNGSCRFGVNQVFMFVQVIKGKISDPQKVRSAMQTWLDELSPTQQRPT